VNGTNARTVPDDASETALFAELTPKRADFAERVLAFDCCVKKDLQPLRIDRLAQVVVRAFLDRFDGAVHRSLGGQEDKSDVAQLVLQRPQKIEAAHPRHDQV